MKNNSELILSVKMKLFETSSRNSLNQILFISKSKSDIQKIQSSMPRSKIL
jgi:hypothetical protein